MNFPRFEPTGRRVGCLEGLSSSSVAVIKKWYDQLSTGASTIGSGSWSLGCGQLVSGSQANDQGQPYQSQSHRHQMEQKAVGCGRLLAGGEGRGRQHPEPGSGFAGPL